MNRHLKRPRHPRDGWTTRSPSCHTHWRCAAHHYAAAGDIRSPPRVRGARAEFWPPCAERSRARPPGTSWDSGGLIDGLGQQSPQAARLRRKRRPAGRDAEEKAGYSLRRGTTHPEGIEESSRGTVTADHRQKKDDTKRCLSATCPVMWVESWTKVDRARWEEGEATREDGGLTLRNSACGGPR